MNDAQRLQTLTDIQLVEELGYKLPGSQIYGLIQFEMQRRVTSAQKLAADATLRGAVAAERYTKATWLLLAATAVSAVVTALGLLQSFFK